MKMETVEAPKTVVVKRSKWLRGNVETSCLRERRSGKMCCLGFLTCEAGFRTIQINGQLEPANLTKCIKGLTEPLKDNFSDKIILVNTKTCENMMIINDNAEIDDETRERQIIREGKKIDVNFEFVK